MNTTAAVDYIDVAPEKIELLNRDQTGEVHTQPLSDITESGTLVDPETGEDMELIGTRVNNEVAVATLSPEAAGIILQGLYQQLAQTEHYQHMTAHLDLSGLQGDTRQVENLADSANRLRALIQAFEQTPPTTGTPTRRVSWTIDIDGSDSPAHAALSVWQDYFGRHGRPNEDESCVFTVVDSGSKQEVTIDLSDDIHKSLFT